MNDVGSAVAKLLDSSAFGAALRLPSGAAYEVNGTPHVTSQEGLQLVAIRFQNSKLFPNTLRPLRSGPGSGLSHIQNAGLQMAIDRRLMTVTSRKVEELPRTWLQRLRMQRPQTRVRQLARPLTPSELIRGGPDNGTVTRIGIRVQPDNVKHADLSQPGLNESIAEYGLFTPTEVFDQFAWMVRDPEFVPQLIDQMGPVLLGDQAWNRGPLDAYPYRGETPLPVGLPLRPPLDELRNAHTRLAIVGLQAPGSLEVITIPHIFDSAKIEEARSQRARERGHSGNESTHSQLRPVAQQSTPQIPVKHVGGDPFRRVHGRVLRKRTPRFDVGIPEPDEVADMERQVLSPPETAGPSVESEPIDPRTAAYGPAQPNYAQAQPQPGYAQPQPQPQPGYAQAQPQPGYAPPQPQPGYAQTQPQPGYGQQQPQPNYAQPQPQPNYAQPQPGYAPPQAPRVTALGATQPAPNVTTVEPGHISTPYANSRFAPPQPAQRAADVSASSLGVDPATQGNRPDAPLVITPQADLGQTQQASAHLSSDPRHTSGDHQGGHPEKSSTKRRLVRRPLTLPQATAGSYHVPDVTPEDLLLAEVQKEGRGAYEQARLSDNAAHERGGAADGFSTPL